MIPICKRCATSGSSTSTARRRQPNATRSPGAEVVHSWQRTTCEQGLFYRDHRDDLISRYAGQYILLQQGQVR